MKTIGKKIMTLSIIIVILNIIVLAHSQTAGNLTFTCTTTAPSTINWSNKHVMAIWIENTSVPSAFIKTKAKYGSQDDHLTSWVAKSGKNLVDATTGATLTSYGTPSVIWNGTNVSSVVVADGTYNVFIEMGWGTDKTADHSVLSFTFTKGPNAQHLTPTGNSNYSNVVVDWAPVATLINSVENQKSISVFPNPTDGLIKLKINQNIPTAMLIVENVLGKTVLQKKIEDGFTGILDVDLKNSANGIYFLKVISPNEEYIYKIILNK